MTENKDKHSDKEKDKDKINEQHDKQEHVKDKEQHDSQHLEVPGTRSGGRTGPSAQGGAGGGDEAFYNTTCVSFQSEILLLEVDADTDADVVRNSHKDETFGTQRVYKKTSPNCVLTLYLPTREITLAGQTSSILRGIVFVDPKAIQGYRVYAQLTLTFRYGREDEEVMGLRFCNEAIMSLHQVWPRSEEPARESLSPLQDALLKRLGDGAHPFTLTLTPQAPPSVQLVPAKRYYGAPIGTSYDVRCFIADKTDEKFHRRASVKMGVRVIYRTDVFHQHDNGPENFAALINASNNSQTASPPMTAALTSPPSANAAGNPPFTCTSNSAGQLTTASSSTSSNQNSQQSLQDSTTTAPTCCDAQLPTPHSPTVVATTTAAATTATHPTCTSMTAATNPPPPPPTATCIKPRKSERGDSFPKLRLSPKSFRFSGRFGRSKSEIEKCPNDPFYHYSKSFQEYDSISGGGPQGAVDKPFLLQDGRVGLRASLDKAWYTHGEDVCVTVNIRNDSRKTVRKVRVCAIQHVDVCMFNNGKFKNVVADSDNNSPVDRTVPPGASLNTTIVLKPQRGPTKNWIALEDTLQRSTEPDEITGYIAASAIRSPLLLPAASGGHTPNPSPNAIACCIQQQQHQQQQQQLHQQQCQHGHYHHYYQQHGIGGLGGGGEDRNVFAIYVSYYVKVKLTLSGMGGELSLKLPFILVHVDEVLRRQREMLSLGSEELQKLALTDVPAAAKKNGHKNLKRIGAGTGNGGAATIEDALNDKHLDTIESIEDEVNIKIPIPITEATENHNNNGNGNGNGSKRKLKRSETIAKDFEDADVINEEEEHQVQTATTAINQQQQQLSQLRSSIDMENVHIVQIHAAEVATTTTATVSEETTTDDVQAEIIQPDAVPHEPDVLHKEEQESQQSSISVEIHATNANDTGAGDGDGDGV